MVRADRYWNEAPVVVQLGEPILQLTHPASPQTLSQRAPSAPLSVMSVPGDSW